MVNARTILMVISLVCTITAEELLGYQVFSISGHSVESYLILCLFQSLLALLLVGASNKVVSFVARKPSWVILIAFSLFGFLFSLQGQFSPADTFGMIGFGFLCIACFLLKIMILEMLSKTISSTISVIVFSAVFIQSFFAPVFILDGTSSFIASSFAMILSCGLLFVCQKIKTVNQTASANHGFRKRVSLSPKILIGFGTICICISFLNPIQAYSSIDVLQFILFTLTTHILAATVFGLFFFKLRDYTFSDSFRTINTLTIVAFILIAVFGQSSLVPRFICTVVFSLFEFVTFLAIAELSSYSKTKPLKLFGMYYLIVRSFSAAGLILARLDLLLGDADHSYSIIGIILFVLIVICAIWMLTDKTINDFFWGKASHKPDSAEPDHKAVETYIENRTGVIAQEFNFTPREIDVFKLMAAGRSSTFIAEELYLSSNTVRKHIAHIYEKCGIHSKQELLSLVQSKD